MLPWVFPGKIREELLIAALPAMSGFACEFTNEPPECLQSCCPICLLVLREPYQVTCCGKSFCRGCVQIIETEDQPCPTCKKDNFNAYPNKGLQQPLYGFRVFCSNFEGGSGCNWQGELGQLEQHLNVEPDRDQQLEGCSYTTVHCLFCDEEHQRSKIGEHQTSNCLERPFTCTMCFEYESTCADVITSHAPECKCRPVECPNTCGVSNLQHQHLKEHVSTKCPLSYVECEFSNAGCDAKVHRKDLPSHLSDNIVSHMSLLARENRKLKQKLKKQSGATSNLMAFIRSFPLDSIQRDIIFSSPQVRRGNLSIQVSQPFYVLHGGYRLDLVLCRSEPWRMMYRFLDSEFDVYPRSTVHVRALLVDQENGSDHIKLDHTLEYDVTGYKKTFTLPTVLNFRKYIGNGAPIIRIKNIRVVTY